MYRQILMDARTNASAPGTICQTQPTMLKTIPQREELFDSLEGKYNESSLKPHDFSDEEMQTY